MRFDRSPFDRRGTSASIWLGEVKASFRVSSPALRAVSRLTAESVQSRFAVTGRMKGLISAQGTVQSQFAVSGRMTLVVPLIPVPIHSAFSGNKPALRSTAYTFVGLADLVLQPGETLIVDTDELTITVNGRNALEFWQSGSTFFRLGPGENQLFYFDQNRERKAHITVTWRDRWL